MTALLIASLAFFGGEFRTISGLVASVDAKEIAVSAEMEDRTLTIDADTTIVVDGVPAKVGDISAGDSVTATFKAGASRATRIEVTTPKGQRSKPKAKTPEKNEKASPETKQDEMQPENDAPAKDSVEPPAIEGQVPPPPIRPGARTQPPFDPSRHKQQLDEFVRKMQEPSELELHLRRLSQTTVEPFRVSVGADGIGDLGPFPVPFGVMRIRAAVKDGRTELEVSALIDRPMTFAQSNKADEKPKEGPKEFEKLEGPDAVMDALKKAAGSRNRRNALRDREARKTVLEIQPLPTIEARNQTARNRTTLDDAKSKAFIEERKKSGEYGKAEKLEAAGDLKGARKTRDDVARAHAEAAQRSISTYSATFRLPENAGEEASKRIEIRFGVEKIVFDDEQNQKALAAINELLLRMPK